MLIHDRVYCDLCQALVGQLFNTSAINRFGITSDATAPCFVVCPDCQDDSELVDSIESPAFYAVKNGDGVSNEFFGL